jgi:hypothetical protein
VLTPGRFQLRSWVFIYFGLIAAILLAGQPSGPEAEEARAIPQPAVIVDSPLLRRDI